MYCMSLILQVQPVRGTKDIQTFLANNLKHSANKFVRIIGNLLKGVTAPLIH